MAPNRADDEVDLTTWIGRTESTRDVVVPTPVAALHATLDHPGGPIEPGTPLPPLWHWLYFLPLHRQSELGPDGHAERGGFLPPVPLPRRMWAGGRFDFRSPLRVGDEIVRTSTVENVVSKQGRTGPLVFVTVRHEVRANGATDPALVEHHDIVYRAEKQPGEVEPPPAAAASGAPWQRTIVPDDVLLFRYSALTFNGHRIHYDRRYVTEVEGYPGLVVHGPLLATLLLDLLRRNAPRADVATFRFRAVRPTFDLHPFQVHGEPGEDGSVRLWSQDHEGRLTMDAVATLRRPALGLFLGARGTTHAMAQNEDRTVEVADEMAPGDEAPAGTPGTGEDVCPKCNSSGEVDGEKCQNCGGTGRIVSGISGA